MLFLFFVAVVLLFSNGTVPKSFFPRIFRGPVTGMIRIGLGHHQADRFTRLFG